LLYYRLFIWIFYHIPQLLSTATWAFGAFLPCHYAPFTNIITCRHKSRHLRRENRTKQKVRRSKADFVYASAAAEEALSFSGGYRLYSVMTQLPSWLTEARTAAFYTGQTVCLMKPASQICHIISRSNFGIPVFNVGFYAVISV